MIKLWIRFIFPKMLQITLIVVGEGEVTSVIVGAMSGAVNMIKELLSHA